MAYLKTGNCNLDAFMDLIAHCEGTSTIEASDDGYNVVVGGALFKSYADHPRQRIFCEKYNVWSSAAGRYQIILRTWESLRKELRLVTFTPESQDKACLELIKQRGAYGLIKKGFLREALVRCSPEWASLPASESGQLHHTFEECEELFLKLGGRIV